MLSTSPYGSNNSRTNDSSTSLGNCPTNNLDSANGQEGDEEIALVQKFI